MRTKFPAGAIYQHIKILQQFSRPHPNQKVNTGARNLQKKNDINI